MPIKKRYPIVDIVDPSTSIVKQITIDSATDFTDIYETDFGLNEGVVVQNQNSSENILVRHSSNDHSTKSGFLLTPGKSLFIECGNLKNVQVVNESKTGTVNIQIIGG